MTKRQSNRWITCGLIISLAVIGVLLTAILGILVLERTDIMGMNGLDFTVRYVTEILRLNLVPNTDQQPPVAVATSRPIVVPTTEVWVWYILEPYDRRVELRTDWEIIESNRRPEPTDPIAMGSEPLGHDCVDFILAGPGQGQIVIKMPCGFGEGSGGPCGPDTVFVQALGNDNYLVRIPSSDNLGWIYQISFPGEWEDQNGVQTGPFCFISTDYVMYYEPNRTADQITVIDEDVDRIMLSLLRP